MARRKRFAPLGCPFHVVNRGVERRRIFRTPGEYREFLRLLNVAKQRYHVMVFGFCLMPNHFHAVLQPEIDGALSAYMQWVQARYACDLRMLSGTIGQGHVFQRRFWSDAIADAGHFFRVLRYVEANAHRSALVRRAEHWPWSSLALRRKSTRLLDPLPWPLPNDWTQLVNAEQPDGELASIRHPKPLGRPPDVLFADTQFLQA